MKYVAAVFSLTIALFASTFAQTMEFSYQGQLQNSGAATSGNFDFEFALFDSQFGGSQIGSTLSRNGVVVSNGIFSVNLDFGAVFPGANRFLEIRVRSAGGGAFTTLSPRQAVNSAPYSVKALNSETAANATNALNAQNAVTFSGTLAGDVTGAQSSTAVTRIRGTNVSTTTPTNGQVLKFSSATNQWQPDTDNAGSGGGGGTITGVVAGTGLTGGGTSGSVSVAIANGGVGTTQLADGAITDAKIVGISGGKVSGAVATATNSTSSVSFTGPLGGDITGTQSATTIAPGSVNTSKLADASVTNSKIVDVAASKLTGTLPVSAIPPGSGSYIQNQTVATQADTGFNISGNGTLGGTLNAQAVTAALGFNIGQSRVLSLPDTQNLYVGRFAGSTSSPGNSNTITGNLAGSTLESGDSNSLFGFQAASGILAGSENTFIGVRAGAGNGTSIRNTALGFESTPGFTGTGNIAIGWRARVGNFLENATAIGTLSTVTQNNSIVLGAIAGANGAVANTSVGVGTTAPRGGLEVNRNWDGSHGALTVTGDRPTIRFSSNNAVSANQQWLLHVGGAAGAVPAGSLAFFNGGTGGNSFGSPVFAVTPTNTVIIGNVPNGTGTSLCRNAALEITNCSASSLRYKTNIVGFTAGLDVIRRLTPIAFDWKNGGLHDFGFGAEDVAAIEPMLAHFDANGVVEGVKYDRIAVVLVNAIKEQQRQIETQQARIDEQDSSLAAERAENMKMRLEINRLKAAVCELFPGKEFCGPKK